MGWIRILMDPEFCLDPEIEKFKAGSGSGINHAGSTFVQKSHLAPSMKWNDILALFLRESSGLSFRMPSYT